MWATFGPCLVAALVLIAPSLSAQEVEPKINYRQRIELAKELLEPTRQKATADPTSSERLHFFTPHWAAIDPAWTANFILENPVPDDGVLYDNKAMHVLMSRPTEIDEKHLVRLLEQSKGYMFYFYVISAFENLPEDKSDLRDALIKLATEREDESVQSFTYQLKIANLSNDPQRADQVRKRIAEFYESGEAQKLWDATAKQKIDESYKNHFRSQLHRLAPDHLKSDFELPGDSQNTVDFLSIMGREDLNEQQKAAVLRNLKKYDFGKMSHHHFPAASQLGSVALLDHELALSWANTAPDPAARVWARLCIAPSLAKHDKLAAQKMIRECYAELLELDQSERVEGNYNFPPATIGSVGLRLVAAVDPALLGDCIDKTIVTIEPLTTTRVSTAQAHIFKAIAGIARYDQTKAQKLFDEYSDDVALSSSASFFCALLALSPDQVADEYWEMPGKTDRTDWRIHVRNAILPALLAKTDNGFWDALSQTSLMGIDAKILAVSD